MADPLQSMVQALQAIDSFIGADLGTRIVDLFDFSAWSSCTTGPNTADTAVPQGCDAFDFNADSDVDLLDFAALQRLFKGR